MADVTPRFALPLLAAGQAQKEMFHNEALATLDALVQPCVEACGLNDPPSAPTVGQSWIVGPAPTDDWGGHAQNLATWAEGGWRFAVPREGMDAWVSASGLVARYAGGVWTVGDLPAARLVIGGQQVIGPRLPAITAANGGSTVDAEARTVIDALIVALKTHGLISV